MTDGPDKHDRQPSLGARLRLQLPADSPLGSRLRDQLAQLSLRLPGVTPELLRTRGLANTLRIPVSDELRQAARRMHDRWLTPELADQMRRAKEGFDKALPPNWTGHNIFVSEAATCTTEQGLPLAWVPDGDTVVRVLAESELPARMKVLQARRHEVLTSCRERVGEINHLPLQDAALAVDAAALALADGHDMAAQALSATIVETLVVEVFGRPKHEQTLSNAFRLSGETTLRKFRTALVIGAVEHALAEWWPRKDPTPRRFNRHATAHTLAAAQYTADNALVGLMLATSMAREAQELVATGVIPAT
jgi:hypothetical protein